jgi:hypothetical protein
MSLFVSLSRTWIPVHTSIQEQPPLTRGRTTINERWTLSNSYKAVTRLVTCTCFACFRNKSKQGRRSQRSMVLTRRNNTTRASGLVSSCAWVFRVALSSTSAVWFRGFLYDSVSVYTKELSKSVVLYCDSRNLNILQNFYTYSKPYIKCYFAAMKILRKVSLALVTCSEGASVKY